MVCHSGIQSRQCTVKFFYRTYFCGVNSHIICMCAVKHFLTYRLVFDRGNFVATAAPISITWASNIHCVSSISVGGAGYDSIPRFPRPGPICRWIRTHPR